MGYVLNWLNNNNRYAIINFITDITDKRIIRKYFFINPSLLVSNINESWVVINADAEFEWGRFDNVRFDVGDNVRSRLWLRWVFNEVVCVWRYTTGSSPKLKEKI